MTQDQVKRKRALVVEDEPIISRVCYKTLTGEGFDVDVAANGLIAKDLVGQRAYDLCLSDIRTPQMSGIELYKFLLREQPWLAAKVIFTTGDVFNNDVESFLKESNQPFLPKPFLPGKLKDIVRKM